MPFFGIRLLKFHNLIGEYKNSWRHSKTMPNKCREKKYFTSTFFYHFTFLLLCIGGLSLTMYFPFAPIFLSEFWIKILLFFNQKPDLLRKKLLFPEKMYFSFADDVKILSDSLNCRKNKARGFSKSKQRCKFVVY